MHMFVTISDSNTMIVDVGPELTTCELKHKFRSWVEHCDGGTREVLWDRFVVRDCGIDDGSTFRTMEKLRCGGDTSRRTQRTYNPENWNPGCRTKHNG